MDSKEQSILEARINDAFRQCNDRKIPKFVGFLDAAGAALTVSVAAKYDTEWLLFGGYGDAERVFVGVFPDWAGPDKAQFPIVRLKICNKSDKKLNHRDVLGALMSAGIERDSVGDILTSEKDPIVFVFEGVVEHLIAHIQKIASAGVELVRDSDTELPSSNSFCEMSGTVASLRLDCVISQLANISRSKALQYIESGMVAVNGLEVLKATKEIKNGDILSIRRS